MEPKYPRYPELFIGVLLNTELVASFTTDVLGNINIDKLVHPENAYELKVPANGKEILDRLVQPINAETPIILHIGKFTSLKAVHFLKAPSILIAFGKFTLISPLHCSNAPTCIERQFGASKLDNK